MSRGLDLNEAYIETIKAEETLFKNFSEEMFKEYWRHYLKQGDNWKTCDKLRLLSLLHHSVEKHEYHELLENPSHFIDIANFALFCYFSYKPSTLELSPKGDCEK